jgi:quercetin dioxygenase-like cupin family protein
MITEDLPPGTAIPVHRHDNADEILLVQKGTGIATLGEKRAKVTAGATIFIPRGTWVGLENTGQETISIVAIFSALGYDEYFRATSVPEGQEVTPLSPDEVLKIRQKYRDYIIFKEP